MSRLPCHCGHAISDSHYPSRTEGTLLRQVESERLSSAFPSVVNEYLTACREGRRDSWLAARFDDRYPAASLSDGEVIDDLLSAVKVELGLSVTECDRCGRLWIQWAPGANRYTSFVSEDGPAAGILDPDRKR
jgi:hypothetical protein